MSENSNDNIILDDDDEVEISTKIEEENDVKHHKKQRKNKKRKSSGVGEDDGDDAPKKKHKRKKKNVIPLEEEENVPEVTQKRKKHRKREEIDEEQALIEDDVKETQDHNEDQQPVAQQVDAVVDPEDPLVNDEELDTVQGDIGVGGSNDSEAVKRLIIKIKKKLSTYESSVDDVNLLAEYACCIVTNKSKSEMISELDTFLGEETSEFVAWVINCAYKQGVIGVRAPAASDITVQLTEEDAEKVREMDAKKGNKKSKRDDKNQDEQEDKEARKRRKRHERKLKRHRKEEAAEKENEDSQGNENSKDRDDDDETSKLREERRRMRQERREIRKERERLERIAEKFEQANRKRSYSGDSSRRHSSRRRHRDDDYRRPVHHEAKELHSGNVRIMPAVHQSSPGIVNLTPNAGYAISQQVASQPTALVVTNGHSQMPAQSNAVHIADQNDSWSTWEVPPNRNGKLGYGGLNQMGNVDPRQLRQYRYSPPQQQQALQPHPQPMPQKQTASVKWRVIRDEVLVREQVDVKSAHVQTLHAGEIVEVAGNQNSCQITLPNGVVRMQIRHPSSEVYPQPIGWVTITAEAAGGPRYLEPGPASVFQNYNPFKGSGKGKSAKGGKKGGTSSSTGKGNLTWQADGFVPPPKPKDAPVSAFQVRKGIKGGKGGKSLSGFVNPLAKPISNITWVPPGSEAKKPEPSVVSGPTAPPVPEEKVVVEEDVKNDAPLEVVM